MGDKEVGGKIYQFGLNGTTNGAPYTSNKWNSNGIKVADTTGGGGRGSSGGSGGSGGGNQLPSIKVPPEVGAAAEEVKESLESLAGQYNSVQGVTVGEPVAVSENKSKVAVSVKLEKSLDLEVEENLAEVRSAAQEAAESVVSKADANSDVVFKIPVIGEKTVSSEKASDQSSELIEKWVTKENKALVVGKTTSVTIVISGNEVTYNITLTE